jgi:hypothetical protein
MFSSIKARLRRQLHELRHDTQPVNDVNTPCPTEGSLVILDDDDLCRRCSQIDFDDIFRREINWYAVCSVPIINLGSIEDLKTSHCKMCQIFASLAPCDLDPEIGLSVGAMSLLETGSYHLRVLSASWVFTGSDRRWSNLERGLENAGKDMNVLGIFPSTISEYEHIYEHEAMTYPTEISCETGYLALQSSNGTKNICEIRLLDPYLFDFNLARAWLSYCDGNHLRRCTRKPFSELRRFHVFDCRTHRVVSAPKKWYETSHHRVSIGIDLRNATWVAFQRAC